MAAILNDSSIADRLENENDEQIELVPENEVKDEPVPKGDDKIDAILTRLNKVEMENQFYRGRFKQLETERQPETKVDTKTESDEIPELELNYDEITANIDKNGTAALVDLVKQVSNNVAARTAQQVRKDLTQNVDQRFANSAAEARYNASMREELSEMTSDLGDLWNDEKFKDEAGLEAAKTLSRRLGRDMSGADFSDPRVLRLFQPGELSGAASRVHARWLREGKAGNAAKRPLREIVRNVSSDAKGTRRGEVSSTPSTIDDLDLSDSEKRDAKAVYKALANMNPGFTEKMWVEGYLEGDE